MDRLTDEPYAEITRERDWLLRWSVIVRHGITQHGPNGSSASCVTRRGAEREARRLLRGYLASQTPRPTTRVTVADLEVDRG